MKKLLVFLDLVLTVLAVWLSLQWVNGQGRDQGRPPELVVPELEVAAPQPARVPLPWSPINEQRALLAVQENLFHPDRLYEVTEPDPEEKEEPTEVDAEQFELVGLVRIKDRACASIIVHPKAAEGATAGRRPVRQTSHDKADKSKNRGIYVEGDPVGDSGYVLSSIKTNSIILTKGEGTDAASLEIPLDMADETSKARLKSANEVEQAKLEEQAAERERHIEETVEEKTEKAPAEGDEQEKQKKPEEADEDDGDRPSPRELLRRRLERNKDVTAERVRRAVRGSRNRSSDDGDSESAPETPEIPTDHDADSNQNDNTQETGSPRPPALPQ